MSITQGGPARASHEVAGGTAQGAQEVGVTPAGAGREAEDSGGFIQIPDELREQIEAAMAKYPQVRSASIPALWAVQRRYGWCSPEGIRQAAAVMGVTPAYLESVASFYDLFATEPVGRHRVLVCRNISCWMNGGDELLRAFCEATGVDHDHAEHGGASSPDGEAFVQGFECLGACDIAPMASIDEVYYGPLEPSDAALAVEQLRNGQDILRDKRLSLRPLAGSVAGTSDEVAGHAGGPASPSASQPAAPGREAEEAAE